MPVQKTASVKGKTNFLSIYRNGKRFYKSSCRAVVVYRTEDDSSETLYLAVSISKKTAKKAVVRNRIKRLLRESIRIILNEKDDGRLSPIKKMIISWHSAPKHPALIQLSDVLPVVQDVFFQAEKHIMKKQDSI